MRHLNVCSLTLFSLLLLLRWAPDSNARAFRIAKLPGAGPNFGCAACHVNPGGGGERNAFGLDYEAIALAAGDVYTLTSSVKRIRTATVFLTMKSSMLIRQLNRGIAIPTHRTWLWSHLVKCLQSGHGLS